MYTCNLHHHYCHLYESLAVRLEVTDDREYAPHSPLLLLSLPQLVFPFFTGLPASDLTASQCIRSPVSSCVLGWREGSHGGGPRHAGTDDLREP